MFERKPLSKEECNKIYDVLIGAGASDSERQSFIYHFTSNNPPHEWRFSGYLGFGGKLWYTDEEKPCYINCYSEHMNKKSIKIIEHVNAELEEIFNETRR